MIANLLSDSGTAANLLSDSFFNSSIDNWFLIGVKKFLIKKNVHV